jgi:hypothetical protein
MKEMLVHWKISGHWRGVSPKKCPPKSLFHLLGLMTFRKEFGPLVDHNVNRGCLFCGIYFSSKLFEDSRKMVNAVKFPFRKIFEKTERMDRSRF